MTAPMKASYTGGPGNWIPVIRRGKEIFWRGEAVRNRNETTPFNWGASHVASLVLREYNNPGTLAEEMKKRKEWLQTVPHSSPWIGRAMDDMSRASQMYAYALGQAKALMESKGKEI